MMRKLLYIYILVIAFSVKLNAQSLPVGSPGFDDYYRRQQLLGKIDSNLSFTVRPIYPSNKVYDVFDPDSTLKKDNWIQSGPISFANGLGKFQILPLTWQQQYNTDHPYGWNDGAMIPAKGYQTMVSGGFYLQLGPLSVQLRPEYVYAQNLSFSGFANGHNDNDLANYHAYHNLIDWPERYGNASYNKFFLGQSSIKLTFGPMAIGISNENLWWGPGINNSIILTNNAPGFKHLTLNSVRPIRTFLGYFEGQLIAGRLEPSKLSPLVTTTTSNGINLYVPKRNGWRYFTGFNINYHPKWIPGLTLGLTRTFSSYGEDTKSFSNYFPFFTPYQKQSTSGGSEPGGIGDPIPRDQTTSLYARWLFIKAQAEVYFEYGLNDNSYNYSDFIGSPDHSRAYVFGVRKMIPVGTRKGEHILFSGEITQLSQSPDRLVRQAGGWFTHSEVKEGHTNEGQILGAGTGSGGNLQHIDINWVSGLKRLGVSFERYEHNVDFQQSYFADIDGNSRKWVDFAMGLQVEWNYKNLIFNAKIQHIKSLNYQWVLKDYVAGQYYIPHNDRYNLHAQLGVTFRF
jgi:hypothetical protein